jgi:nucleotidyltransferase substrate binding protein (TIGR01987 family)
MFCHFVIFPYHRTMNSPDIRWKQRFQNYSKALQSLRRAVELAAQRPLSELEQQGLIQGFEFTHELAWNVLKDYLEEQGFVGIIGSKNATREAFKNGIIKKGEVWMDMIKARNLTSHTYNEDVAEKIVKDILTCFFPAFLELACHFAELSHASPDRSRDKGAVIT